MEGFPGPGHTSGCFWQTLLPGCIEEDPSTLCLFLLATSCFLPSRRKNEREREENIGLHWQSLLSCRLMIIPMEGENPRMNICLFLNCAETGEKKKKENVADRLHTHPPTHLFSASLILFCRGIGRLVCLTEFFWSMNVRERKGREKVLFVLLSAIRNDNAEQKNKKDGLWKADIALVGSGQSVSRKKFFFLPFLFSILFLSLSRSLHICICSLLFQTRFRLSFRRTSISSVELAFTVF